MRGEGDKRQRKQSYSSNLDQKLIRKGPDGISGLWAVESPGSYSAQLLLH